MRKFAIAAALALGLAALVSIVSASASGYTLSPWAYACSHTTSANPATATDPGNGACEHGTTGNVGYCTEAGSPVGDTPGAVTVSFGSGKLTINKDGPQCDDMSGGATIGGLTTLTAASFDVSGAGVGGGSPRLNVVDSEGGFHFISCPVTEGAATCDVSPVAGKTLKSIDIIADLSGIVVLSNIVFTGAEAPSPTPSPTPPPTPTPSATPSPSPSTSPSATPSATPVPPATLPQTGGGAPQDATAASALLAVGLVLIGIGALTYWRRKRS